MLKVFDKVYDNAPFLQDKKTSQQIFNVQLFSLTILSILALVNYSYVFALRFAIIYAISGVIIWVYQFFSKSYFFNTSQWHITILTYILCLSPYISLMNAVFGLGILFVLGATFLSINEKPIINPTLLGIVGSRFLTSNYYEVPSTPLPYIIIAENTNFKYTFIEKLNNFWDTISHFTLTTIPTTSSFKLLLSPEMLWFGSSSIVLLGVLFVILSLTKSIKPLPTIIYIVSYTALAYVLNYDIMDSVLWFCGVFLISNNFSLPGNKKGDCVFAFLTAVITIFLNTRQYLPMNFIFALTITNIASSLIQHICKPRVFGVKKTRSSRKISFERPYLFRLITGAILIMISYGMAYFLFQNSLTDRQQEYQQHFIQKFSDELVQPCPNHSQVFTTTREYIIHQKVSLYRSSADLIAIIQNDKISKIEIANVSHTYGYDFGWLKELKGMNVKDITSYTPSSDNRQSQLITEMFTIGLQQIQDIYQEILED